MKWFGKQESSGKLANKFQTGLFRKPCLKIGARNWFRGLNPAAIDMDVTMQVMKYDLHQTSPVACLKCFKPHDSKIANTKYQTAHHFRAQGGLGNYHRFWLDTGHIRLQKYEANWLKSFKLIHFKRNYLKTNMNFINNTCFQRLQLAKVKTDWDSNHNKIMLRHNLFRGQWMREDDFQKNTS